MLDSKVIARSLYEMAVGARGVVRTLGGAFIQGIINVCPTCGTVIASDADYKGTQQIVKCDHCNRKSVVKVGKHRNMFVVVGVERGKGAI